MTRIHQYSIRVQPAPPSWIFVDTFVDVTAYIVDDAEHTVQSAAANVELSLLYADTKELVVNRNVLELHSSSKRIFEYGSCYIRFRIRELSLNHSSRLFCLSVNAPGVDCTPINYGAIRVVNHAIKVVQNPPDLWYKDEGSRDKCMTIHAILVDSAEEIVKDRIIPLRVTLRYENESIVERQDIFRIHPDVRPSLEKGKVIINFRIEDVSKNHQGQGFRIHIEPDDQDSAMFRDIAGATSSIVAVRSKRNKRKNGVQISPRTNSLNRLSPSESSKVTRPSISSFSSSAISNVGVATAANGLLFWTKKAIRFLQSIEWQQIGYESDVNGNSNIKNPLYSCPSCRIYKSSTVSGAPQHQPNCDLELLLKSYQKDIAPISNSCVEDYDCHPHENSSTRTREGSPPTKQPQNNASTNIPAAAHLRDRGTTNPAIISKQVEYPIQVPKPPPLVRQSSDMGVHDIGSMIEHKESKGSIREKTEIHEPISTQNMNEKHVHSIFAKMYKGKMDNPVGLPAFDQYSRLLGFYQELQIATQTKVEFVDIVDTPIDKTEAEKITRMFQIELSTGSGAILFLHKFKGDLVKLKEDALMLYWSRRFVAEIPQ